MVKLTLRTTYAVLLAAGQGHGVAEEAEAADGGGGVGLVLVHEAGRPQVQLPHHVHRPVVRLAEAGKKSQ